MFGVDRGTAKWLDRSQDFNQGGEGEGFSEVRLAAAINGDIAAPEGCKQKEYFGTGAEDLISGAL